VKSPEQQAALSLHRTRDLLVKQRTQLVNMIRGLLAEFGIEVARGLHHAIELAARIAKGDAPEVPDLAARVITGLAGQIGDVQARVAALEKELLAWHRSNDLSQRLGTIPGIGLIAATALAASVTDPGRFRSGRQIAASLGLTPLRNSSGGKERMGRISRMGDRYDQPSQVYFPRRTAGDEHADLVAGRDQDVEAVRKVFALLGAQVAAANGRLQVIVLDHADEDVWGELDSVVLAEQWRGHALVPLDWLAPDDPDQADDAK
jgi:transposase